MNQTQRDATKLSAPPSSDQCDVHGPVLASPSSGSSPSQTESPAHIPAPASVHSEGAHRHAGAAGAERTVSAVVRLMPMPPARVDSRNTEYSEPGALNISTRRARSSCAVCGMCTRRRQHQPADRTKRDDSGQLQELNNMYSEAVPSRPGARTCTGAS
jgi:hypothetical protein